MARITRMTKRRLGELLQAEGLLTDEQLRAGLEEQRKNNMFLGEALVKLGFVSEEVICHTIVQQFSLPFMSAGQYQVTGDVLNTFPERMYYEYQFISVDKIGKTLIIVGAGLMNHDVLDELERLSGCKVCQFASTWKDIRSALEKYAKEFKKEEELTSLGTMLIESAIAPRPAGIATGQAKTAPAPAPAAPGAPAAAPAAPAPQISAPKSNSVAPAIRASKSALAPAVPAAQAGPPKSVFAQKPTSAVPAAAPGAAPAAPKPAVTAPPAAPRTSALVGVKPPNSESGKLPAQNPAAPAGGANNPAAPKTGTGLLGLFKKQQ